MGNTSQAVILYVVPLKETAGKKGGRSPSKRGGPQPGNKSIPRGQVLPSATLKSLGTTSEKKCRGGGRVDNCGVRYTQKKRKGLEKRAVGRSVLVSCAKKNRTLRGKLGSQEVSNAI